MSGSMKLIRLREQQLDVIEDDLDLDDLHECIEDDESVDETDDVRSLSEKQTNTA